MSDKTIRQINDKRRVNISIWRDTTQKADLYNTDRAIKYRKYIEDDDPELVEKLETARNRGRPSIVKVFHENIYDTCTALHKHNFRSPYPLLINPGINNYPIAGVKSGASGDEADFIRRSNYYLSIEETDFPIMEDEYLYSPTVVIFKNENHKRIDDPVSVSILNIPPLRSPKLISMQNPNGRGYIQIFDSAHDEDRARKRIFMMFKLAIMHDHDTLVITNYGSDRENPMEKMCEIFKEAVAKYPVPYVFFAIKTNVREKDKDFHTFNRLVK